MKRTLCACTPLVSLLVGLFVVCRSAYAIDAKQTDAALTPDVAKEITKVETEIDRVEAQTIVRLSAPPDNKVQQIELLGKPCFTTKSQ
jgi:cytochrome c peroxidase